MMLKVGASEAAAGGAGGRPSLDDVRRRVEERGLTPCHAFFACFLASLAEMNILNQAVANLLAKKAAGKVLLYLEAMDALHVPEDGSPAERFVKLVESVNEALGIGPRVEHRVLDGGVVEVGLGGSRCRYCPKGVGGAEIPGTACPFPRLFEHMARMKGINVSLEKANGGLIEKRGGLCWIRYRVQAPSSE